MGGVKEEEEGDKEEEKKKKKYTGLFKHVQWINFFYTVPIYGFVGLVSHFITELIIYMFDLILSSLEWSVVIGKCQPV
jgi:hypothetical protein